MARIGPISPSRRIALQVVLCGVLVGTVGLAIMVSAALNRISGISLGDPREIGTIRLRLPDGWGVESQVGEGGTLIGAQAPPDAPPARAVQIRHLANPLNLDCESLLKSPVGIPQDYLLQGGEAKLIAEYFFTVANRPARMLEGVRGARTAPGEGIFHEIFICASMPARKEALLLQLRALRSPQDMDERSDRLLLRRIAESIELIAPPLTPGE